MGGMPGCPAKPMDLTSRGILSRVPLPIRKWWTQIYFVYASRVTLGM